MSNTPHTLGEEFPDQMDKIHALKVSDPIFAQLLATYDEVNDEIHVAETNVQPTSQDRETELRKRRLSIKDQIAETAAGRAASGRLPRKRCAKMRRGRENDPTPSTQLNSGRIGSVEKFLPFRVIQHVEEIHCNRPVADGSLYLRGCQRRRRSISRSRTGGAAMRELSRHRRNQCESQRARATVSQSLQAISGRRFAACVPEGS